jgi:hypothetical protein
MTVYGCTVSLKTEVLPELKLMGHKYKKKKQGTSINIHKQIDNNFFIFKISQRKKTQHRKNHVTAD